MVLNTFGTNTVATVPYPNHHDVISCRTSFLVGALHLNLCVFRASNLAEKEKPFTGLTAEIELTKKKDT